jgi:hypothetical protein
VGVKEKGIVMKMMFWKKQLFDKHYHLLVVLVAGLFGAAFMAGVHMRYPIVPCIFIVAILFSLRAVEVKRPFFVFAIFLGCSAFVLDLLMVENLNTAGIMMREIAILVYAAFILLAIVLMIAKMFSAREVTGDTIAGGICVYLMLGFLWTVFYFAIYVVDQNAFNASAPLNHYSLIHFSFITLTTVGYGDIQPVNRLAMVLSNVEAIAGQMYIAIFISRLVMMHGNSPAKNVQ